MSALWVLALGASIGYLTMKKQTITGNLQMAVRDYETAGAKPSEPEPPDGAHFEEVKQAWIYTEDTRNRHFNERLPESEKKDLMKAEDEFEAEVQKFDRSVGANPHGHIEGVYLEQIGQA